MRQVAPALPDPALGRATEAKALACGVGAAVSVALLLLALPSTWLAAPLAVALVVLAPTCPGIDRRLAVNLSLLMGLVPVVLWVPPVLGPESAKISTLALVSGAVAAAGTASRWRNLVPTTRPRDVVILLAGVFAALVALPLRGPDRADRALSMLSTGIDNSYHYAMYLEQRLTAAGSPLLAANADDSGFGFASYPQWFHKLLTVLAQISFGDAGRAAEELVWYAQLQWLVFVAVVILLTAAFLQSLPDRVPPSLLIPAIAVTWSLVLGVPGALNLIQGHLSFLLAACAPVVIFLLARAPGRLSPTVLVAMYGLVLVTASWMLLLPLAAAALLPPTVATWRRQADAVRWATLALSVAGTAVAVTLFVSPWLFGAGLQAVVRDGAVPRVGLPTLVPLLVGCPIVLIMLRRRHPASALGSHLLVAGTAAVQMAALGGYMLLTTGELTYYFWKLGLGSLLAALVVTTHGVITVRVASAQSAGHSPGIRPLVAASVTLVAAAGLGVALQQFKAPSAVWAAILPASMTDRVTSGQAGDVDTVLRLAETTEPREAARVRLLATRPEDMNAAHASEWFHALSHSATANAVSVDDPVYVLARNRRDQVLATDIATSTLKTPGSRLLVTDPDLYGSLIRSLAPEAAQRVSLVHPARARTTP